MSDTSQGPGWWQASDRRWYPPELHPSAQAAASGTAAGMVALAPEGTVPQAPVEQPLPSFWDDEPGTAANHRPGFGPPATGFTPTAYGTGVLTAAPPRRRRSKAPWVGVVALAAVAALLVMLFVSQGGGPDPHRSPTAVVEDYLAKMYGGNPSAAGSDVVPGQSTDINSPGPERLTFVVTGVRRSPSTAAVSLRVCFNLGSGGCTAAATDARVGTIKALRIHRSWFVDENSFPDCATAGVVLVCSE